MTLPRKFPFCSLSNADIHLRHLWTIAVTFRENTFRHQAPAFPLVAFSIFTRPQDDGSGDPPEVSAFAAFVNTNAVQYVIRRPDLQRFIDWAQLPAPAKPPIDPWRHPVTFFLWRHFCGPPSNLPGRRFRFQFSYLSFAPLLQPPKILSLNTRSGTWIIQTKKGWQVLVTWVHY